MARLILGLTAALAVTLAAAFVWIRLQPFHSSPPSGEGSPAVSGAAYETVLIEMAGERFTAEIADTDRKRVLGLGQRDALCPSCAMLFVFDQPRSHGFWMQGMRFPLDILWLRDGRVVHIERALQPGDLALREPPVPADRVLEVNAGTAERLGLEVGSAVAIGQ